MVDKATLKATGCCAQPDRDEPRMLCGYPLPCPHHTAIIDVSGPTPLVTVPVNAQVSPIVDARLRQVALVGAEVATALSEQAQATRLARKAKKSKKKAQKKRVRSKR